MGTRFSSALTKENCIDFYHISNWWSDYECQNIIWKFIYDNMDFELLSIIVCEQQSDEFVAFENDIFDIGSEMGGPDGFLKNESNLEILCKILRKEVFGQPWDDKNKTRKDKVKNLFYFVSKYSMDVSTLEGLLKKIFQVGAEFDWSVDEWIEILQELDFKEFHLNEQTNI